MDSLLNYHHSILFELKKFMIVNNQVHRRIQTGNHEAKDKFWLNCVRKCTFHVQLETKL